MTPMRRCDETWTISRNRPPVPRHHWPVDHREVIARITDGPRFEEFKPLYGPMLVTGWSSVHGSPVGFVGTMASCYQFAEKAAQLIQLSNQIDVPIVSCRTLPVTWSGNSMSRGHQTPPSLALGTSATASPRPPPNSAVHRQPPPRPKDSSDPLIHGRRVDGR